MTARVLIVEDEAPLAELLRYNLEAEGFQVSHAESGEEAEIMVAEERPDLRYRTTDPTFESYSHAFLVTRKHAL